MTPDQEKKLNDVHLAVCGDDKLGVNGIVNRISNTEKYIEEDKAFKNKMKGIVWIAPPVLLAAWELIVYYFKLFTNGTDH